MKTCVEECSCAMLTSCEAEVSGQLHVARLCPQDSTDVVQPVARMTDWLTPFQH